MRQASGGLSTTASLLRPAQRSQASRLAKDELSRPTIEISRASWLAVGGAYAAARELVRISHDDLQEAALRGDLGLVRRLIHSGASVNAPMRPESDDEFMTLLHILASKPEMPNGTRIIAEIVRNRANVNARSSIGSTPLISACTHKHIGAVEVLLEQRALVATVNDYGHSALNCAVQMSKKHTDYESLSVEVVHLLASSKADLNDGGDTSPVTEAVMNGNIQAVNTLVALGSQPVGLHEAVFKAPIEIIRTLTEAEANPFLKDTSGRTVMDIALIRGEEEITSLLRDFIGDLQRKQHRHICSMHEEADDREECGYRRSETGTLRGRESVRNKSVMISGLQYETTNPVHQKLQKCCKRCSHTCRRVNKNKFFQLLMFVSLLTALFLPDIWVVMDQSSNQNLDIALIVILSTFVIELLVQLIGFWKSYACTFFFWMDVIGILSVPLDHSVIMDRLPMGSGAHDGVVMRAARMAKVGARAGRFTKLVKLMRFLPGMTQKYNEGPGTAKVISRSLNSALAIQVSGLIIAMVMVCPIFEIFNYPPNDYSMMSWLSVVSWTALNHPVDIVEVLADFEDFYRDMTYKPFEIHYALSDGSVESRKLHPHVPPVRARNRIKIEDKFGESYALFDFGGPHRTESLCNCLLLVCVIMLMGLSALFLTNSIHSIVMTPLENLLAKVQGTASNIFNSVAFMSAKLKNEEHLGKADNEDSDDEAEVNFGKETVLLEKVLKKLGALSEITVKKSPIEVDALELAETDRALLQDYSDNQVLAPERESIPFCADTQIQQMEGSTEELAEAIEHQLTDAGVVWDQLDSWDFNVFDLDENQRSAVVLCLFMFQRGSVTASPKADAADTLVSEFSAFIEAAAKSYRSSIELPYHNWAHAVDVTFAMQKMLNLCAAEHYLAQHERFALTVSAACHDVGHPGLTNNFLIETAHEYAIRYNDHSPLEMMHCARLFELARQDGMDVFAGIEKHHLREVRYVCIESILYTDYQHHFTMVKEIQMLYDVNHDLFDPGAELFKKSPQDFPTKDAVEFWRGADAKKQIRVMLLHLCDISNPMKPWDLCRIWAFKIVEEFFMQGDKEKELGITIQPLNDRDKVSKPYSQIGFIEFFVAPAALAMTKLFPPVSECTNVLLENLHSWVNEWVVKTEPEPDPDEHAKVLERIAKLVNKHVHGG